MFQRMLSVHIDHYTLSQAKNFEQAYVCKPLRPAHEYHIWSVESKKGVIAAQRCSVENQKGAIAVQSQWQ